MVEPMKREIPHRRRWFIIRKSKIGWVLTQDTMTAFDNLQATLYHVYDLTNRGPFDKMKMKVLYSQPEEYNSWVDVLDLAVKCNMRGYSTRVRREWFNES